MTVIGKMPNGFTLVEAAVAGPASYATATPPTIVFTDLAQNVEAVLGLYASDGREMSLAGLAGRTLTFRIRAEATTPADNAAFREIADGQNMSANTYRALAYGR